MTISSDYQDEPSRTEAFFRFTESVFGLSAFRKWHDAGGWTDAYRAVTCFHGPDAVANVSVSRLQVVLDGAERRAMQFATVGTRSEYRGLGLSRELMEHWTEIADTEGRLCFLFANDTVLDFYPRFGFHRVPEHRFVGEVDWPCVERTVARPLDPRDPADCARLLDIAGRRAPITKRFGCLDYGFILLFYLQLGSPAPFWFLEDEEVIVVAKWSLGRMDIYDIVANHLDRALSAVSSLADEPIREVSCYFTPDQLRGRLKSRKACRCIANGLAARRTRNGVSPERLSLSGATPRRGHFRYNPAGGGAFGSGRRCARGPRP